jgi:hypothetical protein
MRFDSAHPAVEVVQMNLEFEAIELKSRQRLVQVMGQGLRHAERRGELEARLWRRIRGCDDIACGGAKLVDARLRRFIAEAVGSVHRDRPAFASIGRGQGVGQVCFGVRGRVCRLEHVSKVSHGYFVVVAPGKERVPAADAGDDDRTDLLVAEFGCFTAAQRADQRPEVHCEMTVGLEPVDEWRKAVRPSELDAMHIE